MSAEFDLQYETTLLKYPNLATFLLVYNAPPVLTASRIKNLEPALIGVMRALTDFIRRDIIGFVGLREYVIATRPAVVGIHMVHSQDLLRITFADGSIQHIPASNLEIWEKHRGGV